MLPVKLHFVWFSVPIIEYVCPQNKIHYLWAKNRKTNANKFWSIEYVQEILEEQIEAV